MKLDKGNNIHLFYGLFRLKYIYDDRYFVDNWYGIMSLIANQYWLYWSAVLLEHCIRRKHRTLQLLRENLQNTNFENQQFKCTYLSLPSVCRFIKQISQYWNRTAPCKRLPQLPRASMSWLTVVEFIHNIDNPHMYNGIPILVKYTHLSMVSLSFYKANFRVLESRWTL